MSMASFAGRICLFSTLIGLAACDEPATNPDDTDDTDLGDSTDPGDDPYQYTKCTPGVELPDDEGVGYFTRDPQLTSDGKFEIESILGTGDLICQLNEDPAHGVVGDYLWQRVWGTDFGAIDDDEFMNMTLTDDRGVSADGIVYVDTKTGISERAFRRHHGVPCQPEGVEIPEALIPHGDPALLGRSFFIMLLYEQQTDGGAAADGDVGLYYWDYELKSLYPLANNGDGASDGTYTDKHDEEYECNSRWGLDTSAVCGANGSECQWKKFELLMASDREEKALFRGIYETDDGELHVGIYQLTVDRQPAGNAEHLDFIITPIIDTADSPPVPDQFNNVEFTTLVDAWINEAGVVVFVAEYDGVGALGDHGIFAAYDDSFYRIVDNRLVTSGTAFRGLRSRLEERLPGDVEDSARTRGTTNLFINNAGASGLGNVFFTASLYASVDGRDSGLFVAVPSIVDSALEYDIHELALSGRDELGGTQLGFVCGPFNSIAVNDNNQVLFKSLTTDSDWDTGVIDDTDGEEDSPARLLFYDGSQDLTDGDVTVISLPDESKPQPSEDTESFMPNGQCFTPDVWYIVSAFAMNNLGQFSFRAGCLHSGNGTAWTVFKVSPI
jgi:hypothetical protein